MNSRFWLTFSLAVCGVAMGILVLFAADMLFNSGRIAAHSLQRAYPGCDSGCHVTLRDRSR